MKHVKFAFIKAFVMLAVGVNIGLEGMEPPGSSVSPTNYVAPTGVSASIGPPAQPTGSSVWMDHIGLGLEKGTMEADLSLGASVGAHIFGGSETHDFALAKLMFGLVLSDEVAKEHWYRGQWEVLGEVFGGGQFEPGNAYVVGVTPGLRYDFATGTRWVPFFDAGAGASATDIGHPDLGGTFQFNLQTGPGLHYFVAKNAAITIQYRYLHLSSAGLEKPNNGVNTSVFYVGMGWFF
jgi:lipid A 3-O-deacylase